MNNLILDLKKRIEELDSMISHLEKAVGDAPSGTVELRNVNGSMRTYRFNGNDKTIEYLGKDKESLVKALSQKKYDQGLLKVATRQKAELERTLERLSKGKGPRTLDDVMSTVPESLKQYIDPNPATDEGFIAMWSKPSPKRFYKGTCQRNPLTTP